jgi:hypothetical protein
MLQGLPQRGSCTSLVWLAQDTFKNVQGFKNNVFYLINIILDKQ